MWTRRAAKGKISYFFGAPKSAAASAKKRGRAPEADGAEDAGEGAACKVEASEASRGESQAGAAPRNNAEDDEGAGGAGGDGNPRHAAPDESSAPAADAADEEGGEDGSPSKRRRA